MAKIRSIQKLLSSKTRPFQSLYSQGQRLIQLNQLLQQLLSKPLNKHVHVSQFNQDTLFIAVDSAAWLTQAKMQVSEILDKFKHKSGLLQLTNIKFKVHPYLSYSGNNVLEDPKKHEYNPVSNLTVSQIHEAAEHMQDPDLKKAFSHLASNLKNRTKSK